MKKLYVAFLVLFAVVSLSACATSAPSLNLKPINCAEITTPEKANDVLAKAQIVRIQVRDTVADLYPLVLKKEQVIDYDEKVDRPFRDMYRKARTFIAGGELDKFAGICEAFALIYNQLVPIAGGAK